MRQAYLLASTVAALLFPLFPGLAQASPSPVSLQGYRSNYNIVINPDGRLTLTRLRDGTVQAVSLPDPLSRLHFQDAYVSFDASGIPGQAYRLYQAAFNREPDLVGLGFWIDSMERGVSLETVAGEFYNSREFQTTYGQVSDAEFLTLLYKNVLKRAPDEGGKQFWLNSLKVGITRAIVLHDFSESVENRGNVAAAIKNGITYLPWGGSDNHSTLQGFDPMPTPTAASTPPALGLSPANVAGSYQRLPVQNTYHSGRIAFVPGSTTSMKWTNDAGLSWTLNPDLAHGLMLTDNSNPYQKSAKNFTLALVQGKIAGFYFQSEFYARDGVPLPAGVTPALLTVSEDGRGLHGYLSHRLDAVPAGHDYGFSLYTAMWPMVDRTMEHWQAGLGTWVIPDNTSYSAALLPPDNAMRMSMPNAGPSWAYLFQTIEGGMGGWASTQFPVREPKFNINGTPDGYAHQMGSPGFGYLQRAGVASNVHSIAQLSNRILTPPDGFTFRHGTAGEFLGYAWMALPLTDARPGAVPVGDRSWTLFFNAANFSGPVAFWIPDAWTRLSASWPNALGRGLDTMAARADTSAIEFGSMPSFHNVDANGNLYVRIPRVLFPVDANDTTYLVADRANYSAAALFQPMRAWFSGSTPVSGVFARSATWFAPFKDASFGMGFGASTEVSGLEDYVTPVLKTTPGGGQAFALQWSRKSTPGVLPEYYRQNGSKLEPVDASAVPAETMLTLSDFSAPSTRGNPYTAPVDGRWSTPAPAAGPFTATLNDGSVATYFWYRFIDQPSLQGFGWTDAQKKAMQARVELIHKGWASTSEFMAPPTAGALATLDAAQLVTPPAGLEIGYVPVVVSQTLAP